MEKMSELSPEVVQNVLTKGWMTHDAMWFYSSYLALGPEKTNELNLSAIRLMSGFEVKRMLKAIGMENETIDSADKLWRFFDGAKAMVIPDWMKFSYHRGENGTLHWKWHRCFAHEGLSKHGAISTYQCGIMYRITCWLDALGVSYQMSPEISGCLMHQQGECKGTISFAFDQG